MRTFLQNNWAYFIAAMIVVCTSFQVLAYLSVGWIGQAIVLSVVMGLVAYALCAMKRNNLL